MTIRATEILDVMDCDPAVLDRLDAAGYEIVPADTAQLGRTIKAMDPEAIANDIAGHDQSRYWGAIELLQAIYEDAHVDYPTDTP